MSKVILGKAGARSVALNIEVVLKTRLLIQGGSGSGKSWLLRRLAEQLFGKLPVIIIDPEGEFATLREQFGYVLVGQGGETPADIRSAGLVAHKLLELHASAVCDLYEMKPDMRHLWVQRFLEALVDAPKSLWQPAVVIVDEAHMFCPEKGAGESVAADSMIALTTRGRKRGFVPIFATQRLGKLRKDAAAELQNVLIGRTFIDIDRERAIGTLGVAPKEAAAFSHELKTLPEGHFWAFGPALTLDRTLVHVGGVQTSHPKLGAAGKGAPPPAPDKVKALLPKLADLPQEAEKKALTEKELRAQLAERDRRIKDLERQPSTPAPVSMAAAKTRDVEILTVADRELLKQLRDEFLIFVEAIADKADNVLSGIAERAKAEIDKSAAAWSADVEKRRGLFLQRLDQTRVQRVLEKIQNHVATVATPSAPRALSPARMAEASSTPASAAPPRVNVRPASPADRDQDGSAGPGMGLRRLMIPMAQAARPLSKKQVGLRAGVSHRTGTFATYLATARRERWIDGGPGALTITPVGLAALGTYDPLPTGRALQQHWLRELGDGVSRLFKPLVEAYPHTLSKVELGERAGVSPRTGTFATYLAKLRGLDLIVGPPAALRASAELFD